MENKSTTTGPTHAGMSIYGFGKIAGIVRLPRKAPRAPTSASDITELDAYLDSLTAFGTPPGLSLAVVKDGTVVYCRGFGFADGPRQIAATPHTVYGWWSMTKLVTAVAVLQLHDQGALDIDAPVKEYLPFFRVVAPRRAHQQITVRHLLNHSSGLPNNAPALVGWIHHTNQPRLDQTAYSEQILARYAKLAFSPGQHGAYTNVGYMMLGAVIEAAAGESYEAYVRAQVLQPLGMHHTDFVLTDAMLPNAAVASHPWFSLESMALPFLVKQWSSYVRETTAGRMWLHPFYANSAPPTGLLGPASDAIRFVAAMLAGGELNGQRILSSKSVAMMFHDSHLPGRGGEATTYPGMSYGLGWHIVPEGTRLRVQHRGGGPGFGSEMRLYPNEGLGMVILANDTTYNRDVILDLAAQLSW